MSEKAILEINDQKYEFPTFVGSENEVAIDISTLRSATGGITTIDPGFKNTGSCASEITFLDGEKGILRYRGYSIEELADKADFLEVAYLLIFGELPNRQQLDKFHSDINSETIVDDDIRKILDAFPKTAHPMGVLSSLTSALTAFNPSNDQISNIDYERTREALYNNIVKVLGKIPVLVAWTLRKKNGLPLDYGDNSLGYVENILKMMFNKPNEVYIQNQVVVNALNKLLILHADHEQNCSTSTVRIVGSSHAGLFASISAGISALWGPLHGGANQAVLEMLEAIKDDGGDTKKYMAKAKDKSDPFRLMGFGHRVYKNGDHRAPILRSWGLKLAKNMGPNAQKWFDLGDQVQAIMLRDKAIHPNVDFPCGMTYFVLGIPVPQYTPIFVASRITGWCAHIMEQHQNNRIIRPLATYSGPAVHSW